MSLPRSPYLNRPFSNITIETFSTCPSNRDGIFNGLETFYKDILFLDVQIEDLPSLEKKKGYSGDVSFVGDGKVQMHLAQKDLSVNFKTGHFINPVEKGHIAYRTDDIEAFKKHLKEKNIDFTDWGDIGVSGWHQIFFYDPDGNIIEVHQKI